MWTSNIRAGYRATTEPAVLVSVYAVSADAVPFI
jgi:hypothetical protein